MITGTPRQPAATRPPLARRIHNPLQRDYATFLETSAESGGRRTLLEIELAPGGGNALHVHHRFNEQFTVVEGGLEVAAGEKVYVLGPGQSALAPSGTPHRFANRSGQVARFRAELTPGHAGFERSLRIAYGLAADGRMRSGGTPKSLYHLALLVEMADTELVGPMALLRPVFHWLAARARKRGVERDLLERYCAE
jgi:mannose-6-phosphate isomerase-like protein (cupin superfamily)